MQPTDGITESSSIQSLSQASQGRNRPCPCGSGKKSKLCCNADRPVAKPLPTGDPCEVVVLLPTRGAVSVETHASMLSRMNGVSRCFSTVARKPVDEARNFLAGAAIASQQQMGAMFALWVDDDAAWPQGTVERMLTFIKSHPECDLLAGWCSTRAPNMPPMAWRVRNNMNSFPKPGVDCKMGQVVEVESVAFHFVLHRIDLLKRLGENPFTLGPEADCSEDIAFCDRVRAAGGRIFVDTGSWVAHIEPTTGDAFLPMSPVLRMDDNGAVSYRDAVYRDYGENIDAMMRRRAATQ